MPTFSKQAELQKQASRQGGIKRSNLKHFKLFGGTFGESVDRVGLHLQGRDAYGRLYKKGSAGDVTSNIFRVFTPSASLIGSAHAKGALKGTSQSRSQAKDLGARGGEFAASATIAATIIGGAAGGGAAKATSEGTKAAGSAATSATKATSSLAQPTMDTVKAVDPGDAESFLTEGSKASDLWKEAGGGVSEIAKTTSDSLSEFSKKDKSSDRSTMSEDLQDRPFGSDVKLQDNTESIISKEAPEIKGDYFTALNNKPDDMSFLEFNKQWLKQGGLKKLMQYGSKAAMKQFKATMKQEEGRRSRISLANPKGAKSSVLFNAAKGAKVFSNGNKYKTKEEYEAALKEYNKQKAEYDRRRQNLSDLNYLHKATKYLAETQTRLFNSDSFNKKDPNYKEIISKSRAEMNKKYPKFKDVQKRAGFKAKVGKEESWYKDLQHTSKTITATNPAGTQSYANSVQVIDKPNYEMLEFSMKKPTYTEPKKLKGRMEFTAGSEARRKMPIGKLDEDDVGTKPEKLKRGAKVIGKSHAEGGEKFSLAGGGEAELEDGELIFPKEESALIEAAAKRGDKDAIGSAVISAMNDPEFKNSIMHGDRLSGGGKNTDYSALIAREIRARYPDASDEVIQNIIAISMHETADFTKMDEPESFAAKQKYGSKYRGRGIFHTTGMKDDPRAYQDMQEYLNRRLKETGDKKYNINIVKNPDLLIKNPEINVEASIEMLDQGAYGKGMTISEIIRTEATAEDIYKGAINPYGWDAAKDSIGSRVKVAQDLDIDKIQKGITKSKVEESLLEGADEKEKRQVNEYLRFVKDEDRFSMKALSKLSKFLEGVQSGDTRSDENKEDLKRLSDIKREVAARKQAKENETNHYPDPDFKMGDEELNLEHIKTQRRVSTYDLERVTEIKEKSDILFDEARRELKANRNDYSENQYDMALKSLSEKQGIIDDKRQDAGMYHTDVMLKYVTHALNKSERREAQELVDKNKDAWARPEYRKRVKEKHKLHKKSQETQQSSADYESVVLDADNSEIELGITEESFAQFDPFYVTKEQESTWESRRSGIEKDIVRTETERRKSEIGDRKKKRTIDDISDAEKAKDAAETGGATNHFNAEEYEEWKAGQDKAKETSGLERAMGALGGVDKVLEITGTMAALSEAETPLPEQKKSAEWEAYMDMMKLRTSMGLSNESKTLMQRQGERTYWANARQIGRYGTSAQAVLGSMGQAARAKFDMDLAMGVKDQDLRDKRWGEYGSALARDESMTQAMWERNVRQPAEDKRDMRSALVGQTFRNLRDDVQYYQEFEDPDSINYKLKQARLENIEATKESTSMAMFNMMQQGKVKSKLAESSGLLKDKEEKK